MNIYLYVVAKVLEIVLITAFCIAFIYNNVVWMLFFIMVYLIIKDFKK